MIGRVYEVVNADASVRYVGSTFKTLAQRWTAHLRMFRAWKKNPKASSIVLYKKVPADGDLGDFAINLLGEYDVIDRSHLLSKEQLWINKLPNVNLIGSLAFPRATKFVRALRERERWHKEKEILVICECGKQIKYVNRHYHTKTKKHTNRMETIRAYS